MNKNLIFHQLFEAESSTYTYLLADSLSKEAILIDTVIETVDRDLKLIKELGLRLKYVLDTHIHADHVTGAGKIRHLTGVKTAVPKKANVPCADLNLSEGDEVAFGPFLLKVFETPGHTDASLSFYCEGFIFTGDALLIRATGRTDFQSGSSDQLYDSIHQKLFKLPPDTKVYPAHDYQGFTASTIEVEIKNNPRVGGGKTKEQFVKIMSELKLAYPKKIDEALPANLSCGDLSNKLANKVQLINCKNLKEKLSEVLIVDVRGPEEFNGELGHISEAHQITLGEDVKIFLEGYSRDEEVVFVCRSGRRSEEAAIMGLSMGFTKVSSLEGGMLEWNKK